jgi:hypothetical protein
MTETRTETSGEPTHEEMMSALFAQLVIQQANMAMMLLGKGRHPEGGEAVKDLDAAKLFIDQLEMLEVKTKGNLSREETTMLKQNLMGLRLAFVQAVESPSAEEQSKPAQAASGAPSEAGAAAPTPATEEEHRKKFSKKY